MTGNKGFLFNFRLYRRGNVTYGDGARGGVRVVGTLASAKQPIIEKVYYV